MMFGVNECVFLDLLFFWVWCIIINIKPTPNTKYVIYSKTKTFIILYRDMLWLSLSSDIEFLPQSNTDNLTASFENVNRGHQIYSRLNNFPKYLRSFQYSFFTFISNIMALKFSRNNGTLILLPIKLKSR